MAYPESLEIGESGGRFGSRSGWGPPGGVCSMVPPMPLHFFHACYIEYVSTVGMLVLQSVALE